MVHFSEIGYIDSVRCFINEEQAGRRYRMGELATSIWLKNNKINFDDVKKLSANLPDAKVVIIGEGEHSGFYVYSDKLKVCYKYSVVHEKA